QRRERVVRDGGGLAGAAVAAQVGDDDLEPGPGERGYLVPPQPPGVGKAVQQHHRPPLPGDLVRDLHPVDVHPSHVTTLHDAQTGPWPAVRAWTRSRRGKRRSAPASLTG